MSRRYRTAVLTTALALASAAAVPAIAHANTYYVYACSSYGNTGTVFRLYSNAAHLSPANECLQPYAGGGYRSLEINDSNYQSVLGGYGANWTASSPSPAIAIVGAYTPPNTVLVDCNLASDGFGAAFFWQGGDQGIRYANSCNSSGFGWGTGINQNIPASSFFGWGVICSSSPSCTPSTDDILGVKGIRLTAQEDTGPALEAVPSSNLYYARSWVRGSWPVSVDAGDPSGVCTLAAEMDGKVVTSWSDPAPDSSSFVQCHGAHLPGQLDTASYANGQHELAYGAYNAAGVGASATKAISVDNAPVSLSLSGPTDAASTGGTQYIHAGASAGPSGVAAILCSVDDAPYQRFSGATATVPVSGVGSHRITCYAQNGALDAAGTPASSPTQSWSLTIRQPTVSAISFTRVVDRLRCHKARETIRKKIVRVIRCHPRTAWRRQITWKLVRRNGKLVRVQEVRETRVVVLPHVVSRTSRRVRFRHGTTVSGWLGLPGGAALAGQPIAILTAPDDGQHDFTQAATAITGADGSWRAWLPGGPSRLVVAAYDGSASTEPSASSAVKLIVPARIRIVRIWPRHVRWGGTVHIAGYLEGGYLPPPPAGELVRLRIGLGPAYTTYGVKIDVTGTGRFTTRYTFGAGLPSVRRNYWFQLQALPQDDYPYAPADSARAHVAVGG